MHKSRNTKKRTNKTKKRIYRGGDPIINNDLNETDQSTHSLTGFAKNAISGTEDFVAKTANEAASNIVESVENAAEGALTTAIHLPMRLKNSKAFPRPNTKLVWILLPAQPNLQVIASVFFLASVP